MVKTKKTISKKGRARRKKAPPKPKPLPGDRPMPELTGKVAPVYPKLALNNEWEGVVVLEVFVDRNGKARRIRIIKSSGHSVLDRSFVHTVKQFYRFNPRRVSGKNKDAIVRLSHTFSLEG